MTLGVVAVLIGLLAPALAKARDVSTRVVCSSNIRQVGLGVVMYADDERERMPATVYVDPNGNGDDLFRQTVIVRLGQSSPRALAFAPQFGKGNGPSIVPDSALSHAWDGLGLLFSRDYLRTPGVFYCPSHEGEVQERAYQDRWLGGEGEIVSNYQYRGVGPNGTDGLYDVEPRQASILADGFRTEAEINHDLGTNILRADLAVAWHAKRPELLVRQADTLVTNGGGSGDGGGNVWDILDGVVDGQP